MTSLQPAIITPDMPEAFFNRDISWLHFNRRVLAQAEDPRLPLLERLRFLAIYSSNLDEFVMKRIGLLRRLVESGIDTSGPDGMAPLEQLHACRNQILAQRAEQAVIYDDVLKALAEERIYIPTYAELTPDERAATDDWFMQTVFPVLTPLAVDQGHRFPFISNLSLNLGVLLSPPGHDKPLFARIKIPSVVPWLIRVPGTDTAQGDRFVHVASVIENNLDDLFPGMKINDVLTFRVTRSASLETDEESQDLLRSVEDQLRRRRFADVVRIEVQPDASKRIVRFLQSALELLDEDVYQRPGPLDYAPLFEVADLDRPELKSPKWEPVVPARLPADVNVFDEIRKRDIFVHHPYESFHASVERFIEAACRDPDVLAIKLTIYRTSRDSPFIRSLIKAAEQGKQVACLVELRARFDEHKNVRFARTLEKAGVHVAYGVVGLKTHCKCFLVVRREGDEIRTYAHLGTGNYHPQTAKLYTDVGIMTADPAITSDVVHLFNYLTGRSRQSDYQDLLVAPATMRSRFVELIERERDNALAGKPARIMAKMNQLEDREVTAKLYEASQAGVSIDLIVRGFCCLKPGVPGLSENIRVLSTIGRFLEHSRIMHFADGHEDPLEGDWYIASSDWMYRNLSNRVEAACPIKDRAARARLLRLVEVHLHDVHETWKLQSDGHYTRVTDAPDPNPEGVFDTLMGEAKS